MLGVSLRRTGAAVLGVILGAGGLVVGARPVAAGPDTSSGMVSWVTSQVSFEPLGPLTVAVPFSVGGVGSYRGAIDVGPGGGGLALVNEVGLEDYVQGIAEIPPTWPSAAEEAQAIAARTYVLHEAAQPPSGPLHAEICATDACQVYVGLAREREPGDAGWAAAVRATAGQVVEYGGQPILAMYSSSNGGRTVAGSEPYLRSVADPEDAANSPDNWRVSIPLADLAGVFGLPGPVTAVDQQGDLVTLTWHSSPPPTGPAPSTTSRSESPATASGAPPTSSTGPTISASAAPPAPSGQVQLSAESFRQKIDSDLSPPAGFSQTLPSALFRITTSGPDMIVNGGGRGHGVGMSQYGALGKALRGMSASDILAAYYGGLRPSAPGHLAPSVRVGLDDGMAQVSVGGPTAFRVVDGQGHRLAVATSGTWRVTPGPGSGTVRVIAAPGQGGTPALVALGVDQAGVGHPARLRLRLSAPAAVRATDQGPSGGVTPVDAGVVAAGASAVTLPAPTAVGSYRVTVTADAGGGRQARVALSFKVGSDSSASASTAGPSARPGLPVGGRAAVSLARTGLGRSDLARWAAAAAALAALGLACATAARARGSPRPATPRHS